MASLVGSDDGFAVQYIGDNVISDGVDDSANKDVNDGISNGDNDGDQSSLPSGNQRSDIFSNRRRYTWGINKRAVRCTNFDGGCFAGVSLYQLL